MTRKEEIREASIQWGKDKDRMMLIGATMGFVDGAHWADAHPQSPWIPIDGKHSLPEAGEDVLIYFPDEVGSIYLVKRRSVEEIQGHIHHPGENDDGTYDKYGFPIKAYRNIDTGKASRIFLATYYMPLPKVPEGGSE